jgi:hypothetical protein
MVILGVLLAVVGGAVFFLHLTGMAHTIPMLASIPQTIAGGVAAVGIVLAILFRRPAD